MIPGGLDCAVLEFTRDTVPEEYKGLKTFYYDFLKSLLRLWTLKKRFGSTIEIREAPYHINDPAFARMAAEILHNIITVTSTLPASGP